jgi:PcfJ-like protein
LVLLFQRASRALVRCEVIAAIGSRLKRTGKKKKLTPELVLEEHIGRLNVKSAADYIAWCKRHGLPPHLIKHRKERERELELVRSLAAQAEKTPLPRQFKDPLRLVTALCEGKQLADRVELAYIKQFAAHLSTSAKATAQREPIDSSAMLQLLSRVNSSKCKFLLEPVIACNRLGASADNTFLAGLGLLAAHRQHWLRPVETWRPDSHNLRRQFSSLLHHLLDRHKELPECFISAWFQGRTPEAAKLRRWSIALGAGCGLRGCDIPLAYTRKLWQCLRLAPDHLLVNEALRWAQVVSLGGSTRLAETLLQTRIANSFEQEQFWNEVLVWFINNPLLDLVHVGPIIDYLHEQRFVPVLQDNRAGGTIVAPRQPNLAMRGRSVDGLLRNVAKWHNDLYTTALKGPHQNWCSTGLLPLVFEEGDSQKANYRIWTIRELLSSAALIAEGRKLRHCVASYQRSCVRGDSSIWTLELETLAGVEKLLTIEVIPRTQQIIQARGHCNRLPAQTELAVLQRWATVAGLTIRQ